MVTGRTGMKTGRIVAKFLRSLFIFTALLIFAPVDNHRSIFAYVARLLVLSPQVSDTVFE